MNSSITLSDIKRGNTYVINVSAVNILGKSVPEDINGINNNVPPPNVKVLFSTVHINIDETMITTYTGLLYCLFYFILLCPLSHRHDKCFITSC